MPLTAEQREQMFVTEALAGDAAADRRPSARAWPAGAAVPGRLCRRQAPDRHPGGSVQPDEFLEQLEAEHRIKPEVRDG
jgi:hypothetical protein